MATPLPTQFTPLQDSLSADFTLRTMATQFGDGYVQRSAESINPVAQTAKVEFICPPISGRDVATLEAFLLARRGTDPINFTLPGDSAAKNFLCTSWNRSHLGNNVYKVALQLELVYL